MAQGTPPPGASCNCLIFGDKSKPSCDQVQEAQRKLIRELRDELEAAREQIVGLRNGLDRYEAELKAARERNEMLGHQLADHNELNRAYLMVVSELEAARGDADHWRETADAVQDALEETAPLRRIAHLEVELEAARERDVRTRDEIRQIAKEYGLSGELVLNRIDALLAAPREEGDE